MNLVARKQINDEAARRVKQMKFGQPVTNICVGENHPRRHMYFVRSSRLNNECVAMCTDGNGYFSDFKVAVIYEGHLEYDQARKIYSALRDEVGGPL